MSTSAATPLRIAVLAPDERPNTAGYASWIGSCSGVEVVQPPAELMPRFRVPADTAGLATWLLDVDDSVDAHVLSLDLLVHGGLIPSRLTDDPIVEVIARLDVLRRLRAPVSAYQVVTRLPHYDNPTRSRQEPEYWATHGRRLFELSQAWDMHARKEASAEDVACALDAVPSEFRDDLVRRRLRNHTVNLAALDLAAEGIVADLVITSDDTAPRGLPAADRGALAEWNDRLGTGALLYPGADEVPSVLVSRVVSRALGVTPRVFVACPESEGLQRIAPYEDVPVDRGIDRQIHALGGIRVTEIETCDLVLMVHPPAEVPGDWTGRVEAQDSSSVSADIVAAAKTFLAAGHRVAVADVRYANGSDPVLVEALDKSGVLGQLVAYGGWNTAGNTLGTTLAAGVSPMHAPGPDAARQRAQFLATKIIKDGFYLPSLRVRLQDELAVRGLSDPPLDELPALAERVAGELSAWAARTQTLQGLRVTDVTWPWQYLFTADFRVTEV